MSQPVIQVRELTYRYGDFTAVRNLNLNIEPGEIFGFLGPNGAGKTTTIRTVLDFIRPTEGSIQIFGMDSRQDSVAIRQRLSYLPAELKLWDNWTGEKYIHWLESIHQRTFIDNARRLADHLEFDISRKLKGMSTGMKRKMGIIAALAPGSDLLILDEPTTGLDPLMQKAFLELMTEMRQAGHTIFLSSHNLQEVEAICDRVGIIRSGNLEAVESVSHLTRVAFRWMTLTFPQPVPANGFASIEGISDISSEGNQLRMRVSGHTPMDTLMKQVASHTIEDLAFEHPNLEEIFLAYYGEKEEV